MKIYDEIASYIEAGLNALAADSPVQFDLRVDYNYIEPTASPKAATTVSGLLSFTAQDLEPVQGADFLIASASVDFVCSKELASEAIAICEAFTRQNRGEAFELGDYVAVATYSFPPDVGDVQLVGEIGEGVSITFFLTYNLIKNGYVANNLVLTIDGTAVYSTSFEIAKTRTVPTDNQANSEVLQGNAQAQAIVLTTSFVATTAPPIQSLMTEIMSVSELNATHEVGVQFSAALGATTYKTVLSTGSISAVAGGLVYINAIFTISR